MSTENLIGHERRRKWHMHRGCGFDGGTGTRGVESEHLIGTCGCSIDDEIVGGHEALAWGPGWERMKGDE